MTKKSIHEIQENPNQIRLDKTTPDSLTDNIQRYGLIHPVVVDESGKIICGSRRYQSLQQLGMKEIPVQVVHPKTRLDEIDIRLSENIQRKDYNILELSQWVFERKSAWEELYGKIEHGGKRNFNEINEKEFKLQPLQLDFYEDTARLFNRSVRWVYDLLQLQGMDTDLKDKLNAGLILYRDALKEQSYRNQQKKINPQKKDIKTGKKHFLPAGITEESATRLTQWWEQTPKLFQFCSIIQYSYEELKKLGELKSEYPQADMEFLYHSVTLFNNYLDYLQPIFRQFADEQDKKMMQLVDEPSPTEQNQQSQ